LKKEKNITQGKNITRLNCLVAAGAITRGFQRAFRILSVQRELRESLKADLYIFQAFQSRPLFAVSVKLFLSKWENESKRQTFLTYFKKQLL
jgi:hypothetical protein